MTSDGGFDANHLSRSASTCPFVSLTSMYECSLIDGARIGTIVGVDLPMMMIMVLLI